MTGTIRWFRAMLVAVSLVTLQAVFFDQLSLPGHIRIDAPLLLVVGLAFAADLADAALLAFIVGLMVDAFQFGPFGLHALVYLLAVWGISAARVRLLQPGATVRAVQGGVAVAVVTGLSWMVGRVFGQSALPGGTLVSVLFGAGLVGVLLSVPAARIAGWMLHDHPSSRDVGMAGS